MSHYTAIDTQIASSKHLVRALRDLGFDEVEVHEQPQPLIGWLGGDRGALAHVIVRRSSIGLGSNDLGFLQAPSGYYRAQVSDFDRIVFGARWMQALTQRYAYHVATDIMAEQGFAAIEETRESDGTIRLTLRRSA